MSAWEVVPVEADAWDGWTTAEQEEWLVDVFEELAQHFEESKLHDTSGYLCFDAGSKPCADLGHEPDPVSGWDDDEEHPLGFDGEPVCPATSYAPACTYCEGDCSDDRLRLIWTLPGVLA